MPITETTGVVGGGKHAVAATEPATRDAFRSGVAADIEIGITSVRAVVQARRTKSIVHAEPTFLRTARETAVLEGGARVVR